MQFWTKTKHGLLKITKVETDGLTCALYTLVSTKHRGPLLTKKDILFMEVIVALESQLDRKD